MTALSGYDFDRKVKRGDSPASSSHELPGITTLTKVSAPLILAGVDEAGRGPLVGPVVAAAVILRDDMEIEGLRDSKIVPLEQREALYCEILEDALATGVAVVESSVIDAINIFAAAMQAMRQAIQMLDVKPELVLIDGQAVPGSEFKERPLVKGDTLSAAVAAASILAKVTRDQIMMELHEIYPQYGFDEHKGYACKKHIDALKRHGPSPIHRMTFEPVRSLILGPAMFSHH